MSNGDLWTANISYNGSNLNVSLLDPAKGLAFNAITNYPINVVSFLGTNSAFVGFTGVPAVVLRIRTSLTGNSQTQLRWPSPNLVASHCSAQACWV
jgi:hypothetical protein